jgi:hypothetical protein
MHAEHSAVDHSSQSQVIEDLSASLPHIQFPILPLTFIIKPIKLGDEA